MTALAWKLVRELWKTKAQMLAIALVIASGVALFVTLLSAFDSLDLIQRTYYDRYRFGDVFASLERAPDRLEARIAEIPGVAQVETRVVAGVNVDLPGVSEPIIGRLISIPDRGRPKVNDLFLQVGRLPEPGRDDEVTVAATFAEAHGLEPGDTLTAILNGRRRALEIVGLALSPEYVYVIRPGEIFPDDSRFAIAWIRDRALGAAFDMEGGFNDVSLKLTAGASVENVIDRLDLLLEPYGGLGALPRALQTSHWYLDSELESLRGIGAVIPLIFLAVAAFLLNVVLTRLITLQRGEIAALKALGYGNRAIALHYVQWGVAAAGVGSVLGTLAGAWMGSAMMTLYADFFHFPILTYRLLPSTVASAVLVSLGAAVLGALVAVRKAVKLPPAEAMRPEPPARYTQSWLDRAGVTRWLTQPTRIILRNLRRRPGRLALSVVAVAFGGAILVAGMFSYDAVDVVLDLQFHQAQRYDAQVSFFEPVSSGARHELARYEGVLGVEPFRSVAARLRHGHRSRQTAIQGLPAGARLNRIVDASGRVVELPPDGLVLSDKLGRLLGVEAGDVLTVEVLEGARPVRQVPVVRLVVDYLGTAAYMRADALQRLMREGQSWSGAFLAVDRAHEADLFRELKQTPAVAGVALQTATLEAFEETVAENIGMVRRIMILFALVICFGVIYNTARIALSERSRELATLRVIGFTRGEIAYILLGELAVIGVLGALLGLVLGWALAALTVSAYDTEVYRFPLVISSATYGTSAVTVLVASVLSGLAVRRRLHRLDLIAVLKTRE